MAALQGSCGCPRAGAGLRGDGCDCCCAHLGKMERDDSDAEVLNLVDEDWESEDENDTTQEQAALGKDYQGIPWESLPWTREGYREDRLAQYRNYVNCPESTEMALQLEAASVKAEKGNQFFDFRLNTRAVRSIIVHFQLRNLIWSTSKHDVYVASEKYVHHWNPIARRKTEVMNLENRGPAHASVQISTMCAQDDLLVAGGFNGEMVIRSVHAPGLLYNQRLTNDENAITNAIEIAQTRSGARCIMTSNNDACVRLFDIAKFQLLRCSRFPWAVNYATLSPCRKVACVVGDDPVGMLVDVASGKQVASLRGHLDYSFAAAWHPNGYMLATGNQDATARVWDTRKLSEAVAVLKGRLGAIRSLRFSSDGRYLALAEPADFVHVYDVSQKFTREQEIDLFGEISGISFSPDAESLFVGVADLTYGSLLEFSRTRPTRARVSFLL